MSQHLFTPYRFVIMGVRNAVGRYMHAMILPNQFTSDRVNPKSRTTLSDIGPNHGQLAELTASSINRAKTPTHRRLYSRYGPAVVEAPLLVEGTEVITLERDILSFWESKLKPCLGETN